MTALAVALAAVAAALAYPPVPSGRGAATTADGGSGLRAFLAGEAVTGTRRGVRTATTTTAVVVLAVLAGGMLSGVRLALALVLLGAGVGTARLVSRARLRRQAEQRQTRVVEVCEVLTGELASGQPLVRSLERCVEVWPVLEPAAAAARLDADVPTALRRLARQPGAGELRYVASAWQVAAGSGAGLSATLDEVAASAREAQSARGLVRAELASAQATARLVAGLPLMSLAVAGGLGADPWHFLTATAAGVGCLAAALTLVYAGLAWIDRIAATALYGSATPGAGDASGGRVS